MINLSCVDLRVISMCQAARIPGIVVMYWEPTLIETVSNDPCQLFGLTREAGKRAVSHP